MKIASIPNCIKTNEHLSDDDNNSKLQTLFSFLSFIVHSILIERIRKFHAKTHNIRM